MVERFPTVLNAPPKWSADVVDHVTEGIRPGVSGFLKPVRL